MTDTGVIEVYMDVMDVTGGIVLGAAAGIEVSGVVASFIGNKSDPAESFTASIYWGDYTSSAGEVVGANGTFIVKGTHTYASKGTYTIAVYVNDPDTSEDSTTSTALVGDALAGIEAELIVSTFQSLDASTDAADYVATIDFGDGTDFNSFEDEEFVWITYADGLYTVHAKHTFADNSLEETADIYSVNLIVQGPHGETVESATELSVMSAALSGYGVQISAAPDVAFVDKVVATIVAPGVSSAVGLLTAIIYWGDGTTSAGTLSGSNGVFNVLGGHVYTVAGAYAVRVQVSRDELLAMFAQGKADVPLPPKSDDVEEANTPQGTLKWRIAPVDFDNGGGIVIFQAWFYPDKDCKAKEIGFVQIVKDTLAGKSVAGNPWKQFETKDNYYVDTLPEATNPYYQLLYDSDSKTWKGRRPEGREQSIFVGSGTNEIPARMEDWVGQTPSARKGEGVVERLFETCVVDLNTGEVLASLKWGFSILDKKKSPTVVLNGQTEDVSVKPSQQWLDAVLKWNEFAKTKKGWVQFPMK